MKITDLKIAVVSDPTPRRFNTLGAASKLVLNPHLKPGAIEDEVHPFLTVKTACGRTIIHNPLYAKAKYEAVLISI